MPDTEMIEISKALYDQLLEDQRFLSCLEGCGVDNWPGYDDAREMFQEGE